MSAESPFPFRITKEGENHYLAIDIETLTERARRQAAELEDEAILAAVVAWMRAHGYTVGEPVNGRSKADVDTAEISTTCEVCQGGIHSLASSCGNGIRTVLIWGHNGEETGHRARPFAPIKVRTRDV